MKFPILELSSAVRFFGFILLLLIDNVIWIYPSLALGPALSDQNDTATGLKPIHKFEEDLGKAFEFSPYLAFPGITPPPRSGFYEFAPLKRVDPDSEIQEYPSQRLGGGVWKRWVYFATLSGKPAAAYACGIEDGFCGDKKKFVRMMYQIRIHDFLSALPGIVKSYGIYPDDQKIIHYMEYFNRGDLYAYHFKNRLSIENIVKMGKQVCQALVEMHKEDIVHVDVKPGNILVSENADGLRFALSDFDLSFHRNV